jgi:hypothetical protein
MKIEICKICRLKKWRKLPMGTRSKNLCQWGFQDYLRWNVHKQVYCSMGFPDHGESYLVGTDMIKPVSDKAPEGCWYELEHAI